MMTGLVARFKGYEPFGREYIRKLGEEVRDALRSGEHRGRVRECEEEWRGIGSMSGGGRGA